jgi:flagellum-specific peptidoglycan hydrolase FlgJ
MRRNLIIFHIILSVSLTSCSSTKRIASKSENRKQSEITIPKGNVVKAPPAKTISPRAPKAGSPEAEYIKKYSGIAVREMKRTGVPASITLAQGMLESDYGRSRLASVGNNHFGIKCHNWSGESIYHNDDKRNDCFRRYPNAEKSFTDHSDFIKTGSRYKFLFELSPYDYKAWAYGLKKAGYATNPEYASLIIKKIEENNLEIFDRDVIADSGETRKSNPKVQIEQETGEVTMVSGKSTVVARVPRVKETNRIKYIIVKDGETRELIEKEFNLLRWELPKYNELKNDFTPVAGQILYIQPKRDKAEPGKETYTAGEGDTMYSISQKFGIKLKSIYELNRMEAGTQPKPGMKIWLRYAKPVGG